jgi:hypothetical protein
MLHRKIATSVFPIGAGRELERHVAGRQRIDRVRRQYNQWVANQTLEDYALRFTAKSARRWSAARVANTALGAISFLALEAIGAAITLKYGMGNATAAILVVGVIIFACGLPIAYNAARHGVDIDLLTRGAGFGYIGSTITSLIYASFTFIFFAIEAVILSEALELCVGLPLPIKYFVSAVVIIPLVTYGITLISRFQLLTQPFWIVLNILPFLAIAYKDSGAFSDWTRFSGSNGDPSGGLDLMLFGSAAAVVFALVAQIGEQVDFLRFLPRDRGASARSWWIADRVVERRPPAGSKSASSNCSPDRSWLISRSATAWRDRTPGPPPTCIWPRFVTRCRRPVLLWPSRAPSWSCRRSRST